MKKHNIFCPLPPAPCPLHNDSGLTLVEVLVGMTIMVIALIPLMLMIAGGSLRAGTGGGGSGTFAVLSSTRNKSKCLFVAEEILDEHVRIARNSFGDTRITANCDNPAGSTASTGCSAAACATNVNSYDEKPFLWSTSICTNFAGSGISDSSGADPGTEKTIQITVWRDDNRNNALDSFEDSVTLNTKVTSREKNP